MVRPVTLVGDVGAVSTMAIIAGARQHAPRDATILVGLSRYSYPETGLEAINGDLLEPD